MGHTNRLVASLLISLMVACSGPKDSVTKDGTVAPDVVDAWREGTLDTVMAEVVDVAIADVTGKDAGDLPMDAAVDSADFNALDSVDVAGPDLADSVAPDVADMVDSHDVLEDIDQGEDQADSELAAQDIEEELPPCEPNCDGTHCGDDGCGGSCACMENSECVDVQGDGAVKLCLFTCDYVCAELTGCGEYFLYEGISCQCGGCDDGDVCTDDWCEQVNGGAGSCKFEPNTQACDDGNPCTGPDKCFQGQCSGPLLPLNEINLEQCLCGEDSDCAPLDDGNPCNGQLFCAKAEVDAPGLCVVAPESIPIEGAACGAPGDGTVCQGGKCVCVANCDGKECGPDGCQGSCGECDWTQDCTAGTCVIKDCGFLCDGIPCGSVGPNGECVCGICDDEDPCTVDSCSEETAECLFDAAAAVGLACDDNKACTTNDTCTAQGCKGELKVCDDDNPCTFDTCHVVTGECQFATGQMNGSSCDDGNPCTTSDKCSGGNCAGVPQSPLAVDIEECPCEADEDCSPWDDGDVCAGSISCLESDLGGNCHIAPDSILDCDDGIDCTVDSCDPTEGCKHLPMSIQCVDQASCTVDICDPEIGCLNLPDDSKCVGANPCIRGYCDPQNSCTYGAVPAGFPCGEPLGWGNCSQNGVCQCAPSCKENGCGEDGCGGSCGSCGEWGYDCIEGACIPDCDLWCQVPECGLAGGGECDCGNCDDGSDCTIDVCDPDATCRHLYNHDAQCDDNSECTADDHCVMAACVGAPTDCDDGNSCTVDSCDPVTGQCAHESAVTEGDDCDDGVPCTMFDKCSAGLCEGLVKTCDDGSKCTVDSCDQATGQCLHEVMADGTVCDDEFDCSLNDKCSAGKCVGQRPTAQNTPPGCGCFTDDNCVDDGNICNGTLYCDMDDGNGVCQVDLDSLDPCDDGVVCTDDLCSPESGCSHPLVPGVCDDGVDCTSDYCHPIAGCSNIGWGANCDDGNECTSDMCNVPGGCSHTPLQNGKSCGEPEGWGSCQGGECSCKTKCDGIKCGDNGCGGVCGECPGENNACVLGECQCAPDCGGKECGPDGCGGQCGGCDWENAVCDDDFKCLCLNVECENICCAVQEECVDGYCQNLINPPPVRLRFGKVTSTTAEIIMTNDVPVQAVGLNLSAWGFIDAGGGLVEEYLPAVFKGVNIFMALGFGSSIPVGEGVLVIIEFEEKQTGNSICVQGDGYSFAGANGVLEYITIPPCFSWE